MAGNKSLGDAKNAKKDEFYTQLCDIEAELKHYTRFFKGKTVLCNCDDPYESNFFYYFASRFNDLGLKKLIATCYDGSPVAYTQLDLFGEEWEATRVSLPRSEAPNRRSGTLAASSNRPRHERRAYKIVITEVGDENGDGTVDIADVEYLIKNRKNVLTRLEGNGDFRSSECVELLKEADVVVTNPPFSLFREYVAQLVQYDKKFLIVGNMNEAHYKEVFSFIRDNRIWLGYENGDMSFQVPQSYEARETRFWVDENGQKWRSLGNACWFTNLDVKKRHEEYVFVRKYKPEDYPRYDNLDAIDVGRRENIPEDWHGLMGVPDTFLAIYNPDQFELVGLGSGDLAKEIGVKKNFRGRTDIAYTVDGKPKCPYSRIIIRRKR
ncbi:MAG: adenine-specific methyltransferase EcoRI family protein [Kiritimatiellae bacterium]|nr:adenine-specific methyltransferase EcoRI family protein [Kiritimatiellia bacterium]